MPTVGASVLFDAVIGSASNPLQPGQEGSVIFTTLQRRFRLLVYFSCFGDVAAGMYGAVIVSSVTGPAFP